MKRERGTFWTDYRQAVVRDLLKRGEGRDIVCLRLGVTRRELRAAIQRLHLDQPVPRPQPDLRLGA